MKVRKNKLFNQSLTVGVRTQLCKECRDFEARLCMVSGNPALFHRWSPEERVYFKINCFVRPDEMDELVRRFREDGVVSRGCSTEVSRTTLALVEYPDGRVDKVRAETVRFVKEG